MELNSNDRHPRSAASSTSESFRTISGSFGSNSRRISGSFGRNSNSFSQVVPFDHAAIFCDEQEQDKGEELDLEQGQKWIQDVALQTIPSVALKDLQITTDGPKIQPSTKTEKPKIGGRSRLGTLILEQNWFNVYKRLYLASLLFNILGLVLASTGHFPYAKARAPVFCLGNILMVILVRNEVFLRIVFWLSVRLLGHRWIPLFMKTMTTSLLQSLGGIHSGCGLGAIMWLIYTLVQTLQHRQTASNETLGVSCGILALLLLSALAAFPIFRHLHHNTFERIHRFAGWSTVGMVWAYVVLSSLWNPTTESYDMSSKQLVKSESLWFTVVVTIMIILPWLTVRRVQVETVVAPSKFNSLLHFEGGVKPGLLKRISPSPFSEWHAFGIISDGQNRHTILAGAVGDFTKSLVENPPTHLWVRNFHFAGLPYLVNLYERVLLSATGSGIGVYLSFLLQEHRTEMHVIWITKKIPETFGHGIWEAVKDIPPERLTVIDTAVHGRPNSLQLVLKKAREWRADMVAVTSNPIGTKEIVDGCRAVGIPAFGPIWDS